jgi:ethanolamine utilization microcompartment shell protein EutS
MPVAPASSPVLRVTPLVVLSDIGPAVGRYEALGFERVETGDPGCVGLRAGQTGLILASAAFMNGDFDPTQVSRFVGETVQYVHVSSVDEARTRLPVTATLLQDVRTRGGTRELLVEDAGDLLILAEQVV